jgi:very-short-patch-repair endonuclease
VPRTNITRRRELKHTLAKNLRTTATDAERILWSLLRTRQLGGLRFRRQQPVGPYIVDFFCPSAKLIVELDGSQHGTDQAISYDDDRTRFLQSCGYRVLRFWNTDVMKNRDSVIETIHHTATTQPSPCGRVEICKANFGEG